jgi:hypothetical protein
MAQPSLIRKVFIVTALLLLIFLEGFSQNRQTLRENIPLDSIRLSDPFIMADKASAMYYMTGTGGMLWKSKRPC